MSQDPVNQTVSGSDVFVSYASQDAAVANSIIETLEGHGLKCWIAPRDVKPGAQYADAIVRAINDAKAVVLVMSGSAVGSSHVARDEQIAEDLISEVFLDVWRQAGKFEGRSAVSTWLLAITRFKALSSLRRRKDVELDDEAANAIEDSSDNPGVAVQKKDTSEALRKCLTALSPDHREIVDLVYYHEKSVEEVAEIVGIPENTVKTRLFYARKKLAELLKAAGIERGWP